MYDIKDIYQAASVEDAIGALARDEGAVVICGGSDVLIRIREGKLAGRSLVSIQDIGALKGVLIDAEGMVAIGPATTFAEVTADPVIRLHMPFLGEATDQAGGPQLRNIGTIGGNICNGAPSADSAPALLTLNAQLEITGSDGKRHVDLESFYEGPGRVRLKHGELLTRILIRRADYENFGGHYIKYAQRQAMDIATIGCAAAVRLTEDRSGIAECRLALGVAAPTPVRCHATEAMLAGREISAGMLSEIGASALSELKPRDSWRASKAFRVQIIREVTRRAVERAISNAGGQVL